VYSSNLTSQEPMRQSELVTYYILITAHVQRKNTNNSPALVQKMNRSRSDPDLDRPDPRPVTEPVRSLQVLQ